MFLGKDQPPNYRLVHPAGGDSNLLRVSISPEVCLLQFYRNAQLSSLLDAKNSALLRMCYSSWC